MDKKLELHPHQVSVMEKLANPHPFQQQIDSVRAYLCARSIPYEMTPTRYGYIIECESVRFLFNRKTCNLYTGSIRNPASIFEWNWEEQLSVNDNRLHIDHWIRRMCCAAHYVEMARQCIKAPSWMHILPTIRPARGGHEWRDMENGIEDAKIRISVFVKLDYLGKGTTHYFLDGEDYHVCELDHDDRESDRVSARHFRNVMYSLGSPIGYSHMEGHAPHLEANFMDGGPFTFVPAKGTEIITSDYVLPTRSPEQWNLWVLICSHDVKMEAK